VRRRRRRGPRCPRRRFLDVKAGPGPEFERIDKLYNGAEVFVCGNHGDWVSVVYGPMGRWTLQYGLNTPWRTAYNGPCSSGWAHSDGVVQLEE
jgi:hypothetical protein